MSITTIIIIVTFTIIRFADIPLENFACPPEIVAASRYVEANIGDNDGGHCDSCYGDYVIIYDGDDGDVRDDHERNVREIMFESDSGRPSFSLNQSFVCFEPIVPPLNVTSHIIIIIMIHGL